MSKVGGAFAATAGALCALSLLSASDWHRLAWVRLAIAAFSLVAGGAMVRFHRRLSYTANRLLTLVGSLVITVSVAVGGRNGDVFQTEYLWVALFVGYFFAARCIGVQLVAASAMYAAELAVTADEADRLVRWLLLTATMVALAWVTFGLRARLNAQIEREREHTEELRRLDVMRDEFVGLVSHELRTPLTSIRGYAELLADGELGHLTDDQQGFVEVIDRNAQRLMRLVEDLLFISKLRGGMIPIVPEPLDLREAAEQSIVRCMPLAVERGVTLELRAHPAPIVDGDAMRLGQMIDNLVSNALKFTFDGGSVVVSLYEDEGRLALDVADTGAGIPSDEIPKLFERFFRASNAGELVVPGTGLGLTITRAIVTAHGGTISVESVEGVGTTFMVRLPATATTPAVDAVPPAPVRRRPAPVPAAASR